MYDKDGCNNLNFLNNVCSVSFNIFGQTRMSSRLLIMQMASYYNLGQLSLPSLWVGKSSTGLSGWSSGGVCSLASAGKWHSVPVTLSSINSCTLPLFTFFLLVIHYYLISVLPYVVCYMCPNVRTWQSLFYLLIWCVVSDWYHVVWKLIFTENFQKDLPWPWNHYGLWIIGNMHV